VHGAGLADDRASAPAPRVKPFPLDPEVMGRIRPMQYRDAERVAELHHAAMGNSLWALLGVRFLASLYRALVDCPSFLGFVYVEDGEIKGFIAGSLDTSAMYRFVLRRRAQFVAPAALVGLVRRPNVGVKLLETARYFGVSGADDVPAESLFCSFVPDLRGKRVSGHINKVLFDELYARGRSHVKVTTEVDNEGANRQLQSWGFERRGTFRFYGKDMVTYVLDLAASPRVEPVSRHPTV
jgi:RimJ/RimL family protein N-acetyltransferase